MNLDSTGVIPEGISGSNVSQGQLKVSRSIGNSMMCLDSASLTSEGHEGSKVSRVGRSSSMMNLSSPDQPPTPPTPNPMEVRKPTYYESMDCLSPDAPTPGRGQQHFSLTLCPPGQIIELITSAGKSDLEFLQEIHEATLHKLKELREEIEQEKREQARDWIPGIQAIDDGGKMCGPDNIIGDWDISRELGSGAFASVFVAKHRI